MMKNKLLGDVELTKDLNLLLLIGGLYSLSIALSNTFVNIFLWKQSGEFKDLGLYNMAIIILQLATFILAGRWAKKIDRVIVLRIGVIFLAVFYLAVLFIGDKAASFLLLLGGLLGIGYGFYWLAFNVLTFEVTEPETRDFFNGFLGILTSAGGMIGPILAGYIISSFTKSTGYMVVFGISLGLFSLAVVLSFFLKRRPASGQYLFARIIKERQNNKNWKYITNAHFFQGMREGTFAFVITVFVFIATGSEMALGKFGLINSGISFVAYYIVSRTIKNDNRNKAILSGGILLFFSMFIIIFDFSYTKLLIYAGIIAVAYPLILVPYTSLTFDVIGRGWNAGEMRIEYIVVREMYLNLGRLLSVLIFIVGVSFFNPDHVLPYILFVLGTGHTIIYFWTKNIHFEQRKNISK
ncbi:MFS transporter [Niallia sp. NCCP-28]|uniref:MFS transporter n=1 Tax=Niallia sp. NCCP-28 TaxID=2934712 RepID=UPI002081C4D6|nr:MFS transporter [Niallia sp. NCCP-28]GKU81273.1 MFS transporter [Niallia sp. NCCP-28]